ncbi:metalloprotease [Candidatus Woesearchaeota archaeon]|nr:metalloprotease [Candidatus Woesearchaeota archaeon]
MTQIKHVNPHYRQGIQTSQKEILDLAKAWIILGLAFAIVMNGFKLNLAFLIAFIISLMTIGIGFLFHELAHKFMAQRYGCFAEFRSFDKMLILALIFSFFGFIFAAPGAVMIRGQLTRRQNGTISAAGPGMNILVSLLFLPLAFSGMGIWQAIGRYGFIINAWLALFNMIPFAMFDGRKIWDWSRAVYAVMAALALCLIVFQNLMAMGIL